MTVEVISSWEVGWNYPRVESDMWEMVLREFGVDCQCMMPVSGIKAHENQTFLMEYNDVAVAVDAARTAGRSIVFIDEAGDTELDDFTHPADVAYVFGRTSQNLMSLYMDAGQGDVSVRVDTPNNTGLPFGHQIAAIVLHDRFKKAS